MAFFNDYYTTLPFHYPVVSLRLPKLELAFLAQEKELQSHIKLFMESFSPDLETRVFDRFFLEETKCVKNSTQKLQGLFYPCFTMLLIFIYCWLSTSWRIMAVG